MPSRARGPQGRSLALTVPGLGEILADQALAARHQPNRLRTLDRRSDVVALDTTWPRASQLPCAEDVLIDLGTIDLQRTAASTAAELRVEIIQHAARDLLGHSRRHARVRPVVRLSSERFFNRTALRDAVQHHLTTDAGGGSGEVELWMIETRRRSLRLGIRVAGATRRQSRAVERSGALRPVVAAAMLELAAVDPGSVVLDPCCGTGTILTEATRVGFRAMGGDIDPTAVASARSNGASTVVQLDARRLPIQARRADAIVTNLPFGQQHTVQGSPVAWYRRVLQESIRVAPCVVVLMTPTRPFRQALGRLPVHLERTIHITLLGRPTTIWIILR